MTDKKLTFWFEGHIDSSNASQIEKEVFETLENSDFSSIILDFEKLEYISSAGLRIILKLRKNNPDLLLCNVCSEVYEILEMTGFTEMMKVEKAYRRFSVENCEVIGQGANGLVYRLDNDTIIKVYKNNDALPDIQRERELARKALILGIPTAIPYDVAKVGDSYGSVFELLNAKSFAKLIAEDPQNIEKYIEMYVDLLKKIHSTVVQQEDMPSINQSAVKWAEFLKDYLPSDCYERLYDLMSSIPQDYHMLHGDYHIKNVMLQNDEVLLIDMDTICHGDPVFEFAAIFLAYEGFGSIDPHMIDGFFGISCETAAHILKRTMELYFGTTDKTVLDFYLNKAKIVGYTRLMRRTIKRIGFEDQNGKSLIEHCKAELVKLIPQVDSLSFCLTNDIL